MNRFCVVLFMALLSSTFGELPSITYDSLQGSNHNDQPSSNYGSPLPEISSSYGVPSSSHEPSLSTGLDLEKVPVGYQTSEGLEIDSNLLHKIKQILIEHENMQSSSSIPSPSSFYGAPQSSYGLPSHWSSPSSNIVDIHFDQWEQSIPVAQYVARKRYASNFNEGWNGRNSGWQQQSNGWSQQKAVQAAGWTINSDPSVWDNTQLTAPRWQ